MDRTTCEIRNWPVFAPGTYKESAEYFSPADVAKIGRNFAMYSTGSTPQLQPLIKLGHDTARLDRARKSLGFPSFGKIVAAHTEPNGVFVVDRAVGVPRIVGSAINSGFLASGSVELPPPGAWRPPNDPNAKIDGDILSGVALLGEELPGVPGFDPPRAVFEDGTPVPPLTDEEQVWWLDRMADLATPENSAVVGRDDGNVGETGYSARTLCFSASTYSADPIMMDAASIIAALQADPALMAEVAAALGGGGAPPEAAPPAAPPPAAPPPDEGVVMSGAGAAQPDDGMGGGSTGFNAFAAKMENCMSAFGTRLSAMEASHSAEKKEAEDKQMSAFSAMVETALKEIGAAEKVPPVGMPALREQLLHTLTAKTFASQSDRMTAFEGIKATYAALPVNSMLKDSMQDTAKQDLKSLANSNPQLVGMLKAQNLKRAYPDSAPKIAEKFGVQLV